MLTEEKIRENFTKRLIQACEEKGLPERGRGIEIAKVLKITPKAVSKWLNGETMPSASNIYVLSKYLDVTPEWLTFGDSNMTIVKAHQKAYPLISPVQAGLWTGIDFLRTVDENFEMIPSNVMASEDSFYLKIEGESMQPKFKEGDLVLIDPTIAPTPGKFVAAINGSDEATFKQYKELGTRNEYGVPHFELMPLNPVFPTLSSLEQDIRIIGVAVEKREML